MAFSDPPVLQIEDLRLYFRTQQGVLHAVDSVSLNLRRNEAMVILGESGCGKTSLTRAILAPAPPQRPHLLRQRQDQRPARSCS